MNSPFLALDFGTKRTGVALSISGILVEPLTTISWDPPHPAPLMEEIVRIIQRHEICTVIAGVPTNEDDTPTPQALKTVHLIELLQKSLTAHDLDIPVVRVNEYQSTQDAASLFPNADKDAGAAAVLLQDYLDNRDA